MCDLLVGTRHNMAKVSHLVPIINFIKCFEISHDKEETRNKKGKCVNFHYRALYESDFSILNVEVITFFYLRILDKILTL